MSGDLRCATINCGQAAAEVGPDLAALVGAVGTLIARRFRLVRR